MGINDELQMEDDMDDMDEMVPAPAENDSMKFFMRGEFGQSAGDESLEF